MGLLQHLNRNKPLGAASGFIRAFVAMPKPRRCALFSPPRSLAIFLVALILSCGKNPQDLQLSKPLQLQPASGIQAAFKLKSQNFLNNTLSRDLIANKVVFESSLRSDGTLNVKVSGQGVLAVTTDGTIPDRNNPNDNTIIGERQIEIIVTKPSIIRAKSYFQGAESTLRSQSFVPSIVDLRVKQLPREYDVTDVYVTGPFRGWSDSLDEAYRLKRSPDGSYGIRINYSRNERFIYKYLLRTRDGQSIWWADPAAPQAGSAQYVNNYMISGLETLSPFFLRNTPGFVEEAAIDLNLQPVAALDQGSRTVRVKLGFLAGDVAAVSILFTNGQSTPFEKSAYQKESVSYDQFSGLIDLPNGSLKTGFILELRDGNAALKLGSRGLMSPTEPVTLENAFPFDFNSATNTLNGQDIYQVPLWSIDAIWYQIFPERFRNGDTSNDIAVLPPEWTAPLAKQNLILKPELRDWTSDWFQFSPSEAKIEQSVGGLIPNATTRDIQRQIVISRRYGGDLQGIKDKIPYLKSLGINAVYLNPVFESDSNHKYDTKDYRHIDRHFGPMKLNLTTGEPELFEEDKDVLSRETITDPATWGYTKADKLFIELVNELHANGMRVVIDGVFNHSASNSIFMEDIAKNGRRSQFFPWFEMSALGDQDFATKKCRLSEFFPDRGRYPEADNISYDAWFGYCTLPNHREGYPKTVLHPGLEKHIFDVMERWMAPKYVDGVYYKGIDGVRLDVYGDISQDFWREFRTKIKRIKNDALIIAEEWYDGFDILRGDQTDILMNYTVRTFVEGWFLNTNFGERFKASRASEYIEFRQANYRDHVKYALWSMLESHDTDRVLSKALFANRGLSPRPQDGNSWDDGSVNRPDLGAPYSNDKPGPAEIEFFKGILAFQSAYVGTPIVYYGDEIGMWGSDDPTNRKPMMWPDLFDGSQFETKCTTAARIWCKLEPQTRFSMSPNLDLFNLHVRLHEARSKSQALRRGSINTKLNLEYLNSTYTTGNPTSDFLYLWGFERAFANKEFAYFVSNQNLGREAMNFKLQTKWPPGTQVQELVTNTPMTVDNAGKLNINLPPDRAMLFVEQNPELE